MSPTKCGLSSNVMALITSDRGFKLRPQPPPTQPQSTRQTRTILHQNGPDHLGCVVGGCMFQFSAVFESDGGVFDTTGIGLSAPLAAHAIGEPRRIPMENPYG